MADGKLYFAYGSNINLDQMAYRCPDAKVVGPVTLEGWELLFRGSGVATIGPKEGSTVHGLLWRSPQTVSVPWTTTRALCARKRGESRARAV